MYKRIIWSLGLALIALLALSLGVQWVAAAPDAPQAQPQANDDVYATWMDTPLTIAAPGVLENDTDADGDPLTATLGLLPTLGTLELAGDGSFVYTPTHGITGTDSFTYTASDGGTNDTAEVTLRIYAPNDPPLAVDDAYTTTEDTPLLVGAVLGILSNDSDPDGDPLTATLDTGPVSGTLVFNSDGSFIYTPTQDFAGMDSFIYQIVDGDNPALAYWPFEDGDDPTLDESGNGHHGDLMGGVSFTSTTPSSLPPGSALAFDGVDDYVEVTIDVPETEAAVALWFKTTCDDCGLFSVGDGLLGNNGNDRHIYLSSGNVCARIWSNEVICTTGTDYADDAWHHVVHTFGASVGGQQIHIDGQLEASGAKTTSNFNAQTRVQIGFSNDAANNYLDGVIDDARIYTRTFSITDTQAVMDDAAPRRAALATVTLTVTSVNDRPQAADDYYYTPGDAVLTVAAPGVQENDGDVDSGLLTTTLNLAPTHGDLALASDGGFVYTPTQAFTGTDNFTYDLSDGLLTDQALVTLTVGSPRAATPIAAADVYTTLQYIPLNVPAPGVLGNDDDRGGAMLALVPTVPAHGDLALALDGGFVYTPNLGYYGADDFSYLAANGEPPLMAYWPFVEGGGDSTADVTGNGYDGDLINGPRFTTTVPVTPTFSNAYALDFDGANDHVLAPAIDLANRSFSVAFWARRDTLGSHQFIVSQGTNSGSQGLLIGFRNSNAFTCAFWGDDVNTTAFTDTLNWHHWTCTYDASTNAQTVYLDGSAIVTRTANNDYQGSGPLHVGNRFDNVQYFDGLLDDVRIYESALTAAQVQTAMDENTFATASRATVSLTITEHPTGTLAGDVFDSVTLAPLAGVDVALDSEYGASFATTTDISGAYRLTVPSFAYTVTATTYGYTPTQFTGVTLTPNATTTLDIPMDRLPRYTVAGVVSDTNTGWPLYASIDIDGYPGDAVWTDPLSGYYSVTLAAGSTYTFNVDAWTDGYLPVTRTVGPLSSNITENFALDVDVDECFAPGYTENNIFYDGFESGDLSAGGWLVTTTLEGRVQVNSYEPYRGNYSVLLDDAVDNATFSIAGIILPIDLSAEAQVNLDFWWRWYNDENHPEDGVFISDDDGSTWCRVFSFNNGPSSYINTQVDLTAEAGTCGMTLGSASQIKFQFYDNYSITADGYSIDEVKLKPVTTTVCIPLTGVGLVTGHTYDENTLAALSGATVENPAGYTVASADTPDDPDRDDGLYITYAPAGSATLTATYASAGYGADIDTVTVIVSDTVAHDFYLPAGQLEATHDTLSVTLNMGITATLPLTLSNLGNVAADFEFVELGGSYNGFISVMRRAAGAADTTTLLYRSAAGVPVKLSDSGAKIAYPAAYRYISRSAASNFNILVYTDDWVHSSPNTLVQQAISNLGLAATVYVDDYAGFQNALNTGGPWDLVIWSGENRSVGSAVLDDLLTYLQGGGRLAATYWQQLDYPTHPLWAEMGFSYISNYIAPPPAYWWEPGHPIFNSPQNAPEWINRVQNSGTSQGTRLEPLANGIALAGYTTTPASNEAAMVLRDDGRALYKGLRDVSTNADDNGNGIPDGVELWMNIIDYMREGVDDNFDWLSESPITGTVTALGDQLVDITFDAGAVSQPGTYYAALRVDNDTPYGALPIIPVTMTVTIPPDWGKVQGTLTRLGYCDLDPAPLHYQELLIEGSNGYTATVTADEDGNYQWWLDEAASPLTLTVTYPDHETGIRTGVVITAGQRTLVDIGLRWLEPCVSLAPDSYAYALFMGDSVTASLTLTNSGALSTTFDLVEPVALSWLNESPISGTLEADDGQAIDVVFNTTVLTQDGLYTGVFNVNTTDPQTPTFTIPVELFVVSGTVGVAINDSVEYGMPGAQVTHTFVITNTGTGSGLYDLALTGANWPTSAPPADTGALAAGEAFTFTVTVDIPNNPAIRAAIVGSDVFTLTATARVDGTSASGTGTTFASANTGVALSDDQAASGVNGDTLTYVVQVTNTGEFTDTFNFALAGSAWNPTLSAANATLGMGASTKVTVTATIPPDAAGGSSDVITFSATSQLEPATSGSIELTTDVALAYGFELASATAAQSGEPGTDVMYTLTITNTGNTTDTFDLAGSGVWSATYLLQVGPLSQGTVANVPITVTVPSPAPVGASDALTLTVTSQSTTETLTTTLTTSAANAAPIAVDDAETVVENSVNALDPLANDSDVNTDVLNLATIGVPDQNGTVLNASTYLTYTPASDFNGTETFTYTVTDGNGGYATATMVVTVTGVNDAPSAIDDAYATAYDTPLIVSAADGVLDNDIDPESDPLTATLESGPTHGIVALDLDGSFSYTPTTGFGGLDSFSYIASDGALTDTANVIIGVGVVPTFTLTLAVDGTGHGNIEPDVGQYIHDAGDVVTLTATPAIASGFAGWSGDVVSMDNPLILKITRDIAITATFDLTGYAIYLPIVVK